MYSSFAIWSLTSLSSICEVVILGREMSPSSLSLAVISVSFRWISFYRFVEALRHCIGVLLVWFSRNESLLDPNTRGEVCFNGDLCASTSIFCWNSGVLILLLLSLVEFLIILVEWVAWGCCQTTSVVGGNVLLVVFGVLVAAPE